MSHSRINVVVCAIRTMLPVVCLSIAQAQIVVNTTRNVVDFGGAQQVADLPGPDGLISMREACAAANNTPGPQTIHFAIPMTPDNEWWSGVAMLVTSGAFSINDDETTIDFTTQTAFTGDTNPNGHEVGIRCAPITGAAAIYLNANRCTVKGLDQVFYMGYGVGIYGNENRVISCTISGPLYAGVVINGQFNGPPATGNVVGGTAPGEGNILSAGNSGVRIDGPAENNIVIGNTLTGSFYGVEIRTPTCCPGNVATMNRVGGPMPAERNVIAGAGKYGQEGFPTGGQIAVQYSPGNIIEGNYIGVLADGVTVAPSQRGPVGVELRSAPLSIVRNNVIGGIAVTGINHYAGERFGIGLNLMGDCGGSIIQGNRIGVGADGSTPTPCRSGAAATYWSVNGQPVTAGPVLFGGLGVGEGNTVAYSEATGVYVTYRISGLTLSGNAIHDNGGLGIDLLTSNAAGNGVTPNDPADPDSGGNSLQNYPVLESAAVASDSTSIVGTFNSVPNELFRLEFFASAQADPSGFGEGERFLGTVDVATDSNGDASFEAALAAATSAGEFATATARRISTGDTSEFSNAIVIDEDSAACPGDTNGDRVVNFADLNTVLSQYGQSGPPGSMQGDVNNDGVVGFADLNLVLSHYGVAC